MLLKLDTKNMDTELKNIRITRKDGEPVEIVDVTDAFAKNGFYNVRRGLTMWRYPIADITEVVEYGRAAQA